MLCEVCKGGFKENDVVVCAVPMAPYYTRMCRDCLNVLIEEVKDAQE